MKTKQQLIDEAIHQIYEDISMGDTTAISDLLNSISDDDLRKFLPEYGAFFEEHLQ